MSGLVKTACRLNLDGLLEWYENVQNMEDPVHKDTHNDYAKDYFEAGSSGYGWSLHEFGAPEGMDRVWWRNSATKTDPMIRSKGRIFFKNGDKCFIGNEHFTKRRAICNGYMASILDSFPEAYRGAIWAMNPGFQFVEHIDYPNNETYRFHIVLETNPMAKFKLGDETVHMPADGCIWMVNTGSEMHTAWNYGEEDRVHIHWQMPIGTWDKYLDHLT